MLFNSIEFLLIFLPLCLLVWYNVKKTTLRLFLLICFSGFFYGYLDYRFVGLLLLSVLIDYYCGANVFKYIDTDKKRAKKWMMASVVSNLTILGFFKYFNFFVDTIFDIIPANSMISKPTLHVILPAGISFYVFESMTYSIDIYRKKSRAAESFLHLAVFISMFPRLIAGPIVKYNDIENQLRNIKNRPVYSQIQMGLFMFILGLARKLFIADYFAKWSDIFFKNQIPGQFIVSWAGVLSYAFQIYFDFSAYSEMAVGLGKMLGFEFPQNFRSPYKAKSFSDFWTRWHISLSQFLRDYLYIPLGGNRNGQLVMYSSLLITMLLGGLWHGASWMFVIWGLLHGLYLVFEKIIEKKKDVSTIPFYGFIVFIGVCIAWIFFRSTDLHFALHTIKSCLMLNGLEDFNTEKYTSFGMQIPEFIKRAGGIKHLICILICFLFVKKAPNVFEIKDQYHKKWIIILSAVVLFICILNVEKPSPFIYFQF
jgi:alginate O-acetyltransferase complex protein AlgI